MASSPAPPEAAFPSGVYAKYKRATQCFLNWLLRAHAHGRVGPTSAAHSLDAFHTVVEAVAHSPATQLSPRLLHELPHALAACQAAITLRERVTKFFAASNAADDAHAHFLTRLKTWLAMLQRVENTGTGAKNQRKKKRKSKKQAANDYFAEETTEDLLVDQLASAMRVVGETADRDKVLDEAFEHDLQLELACLLMEMEEMAEQVYETYSDVKRETRTLVEATAVAHAAVLLAQSRVAALQLRYPSIREAQDVLTLLDSRATQDLHEKLVSALYRVADERRSVGHLPGLFLADFVWVASALMTFTSAIPHTKNQAIVLKDGYFGDTYDEETTAHYLLPDITSNAPPFFTQQLPLLYNALIASRLAVAEGKKKPTMTAKTKTTLTGGFWPLMKEYFTTQRVGIPVVFACICWVKSVAALQGNGGLRRHVSVAISNSYEIEKRLQISVAKSHVGKASREIHGAMEAMLKELHTSRSELSKGSSRGLLRANPMLAGRMMLDDHFRFLQFGGESVLVTSRLRAFLHLYCALVDRQLLQKIPLIEELLAIYGEVMLTPSRAAAVHGSYCRTYLLSSHLTAAAVDALFRGAAPPPNHTAVKARDCFHLRDLSSAFRLFTEHDLSVLAPPKYQYQEQSLSVKDQLQRVADQCAEEVLRTRVLSRDLLKLNDDLTDLFESLCDELGRRWSHDEYLASPPEPGVSRQYMVNRALEDAVMMPLLAFLDCLESDGRTIDTSKLLRSMGAIASSRVADDGIAQYCQRAADVIRLRFEAMNAATIECSYFILPSYTDIVSREFGDQDFKRDTQNPLRSQQYGGIMDMLEAATGPLTTIQVAVLKLHIKADPRLLALSSGGKPLPMVLHHAAAGPIHDAALVEWLIQVGALYWQPSAHYRTEKAAAWVDASMLPNYLAVHSAAAAGYLDTVMLLLEAENMRDLNTKTFHTKATVAHIAVKHGHRELFQMLVARGADVRDRNASGQRVSDLTSDMNWKRELVAIVLEQVRTFGDPHQASREGLFKQQQLRHAEELLEALAAQRAHERVGQKASGSATTKSQSRTKSKKK